MRIFRYEDLLKLDYSEIRQITASEQAFSIVADVILSERLQKFLANESNFRSSPQRLGDRIRYVIGGIHAMRLPNLMPLWNRAIMDGFAVQAVKSNDVCEIIFKKRIPE